MFETFFEYLGRVAQYNLLIVAIELLLIGFVVYWAISFLEGTRGERLFRGVITILFAGSLTLNLVVERFHFERLQYLYNGFLIAVLIIAVAAFQPELRRALIRIGQGGFIMSGAAQQLSRAIEEIIKALEDMAATRTGAIIVIQRQVGLGEFIDTGIKVDAKATAELLKTIFHSGSPLHDMAVVISGERIVAARVQLPLAELGTVEGLKVGSRHRAAIGISRGSDATVVVVSEETGIISIAKEGKLFRGVSQSRIREQLTADMIEPKRVERIWHRKTKSKQ